jgi:hypothetical protein
MTSISIINAEQQQFLDFYLQFIEKQTEHDEIHDVLAIIEHIKGDSLDDINDDYQQVQTLLQELNPMTRDFITDDFQAVSNYLKECNYQNFSSQHIEHTSNFLEQSFTVMIHYLGTITLLELLWSRKQALQEAQSKDNELKYLITDELIAYTREMLDTAYDIRVLAAKLNVTPKEVQKAMQKLIVHDAVYVDVRNNHLIYSLNDNAQTILQQYLNL